MKFIKSPGMLCSLIWKRPPKTKQDFENDPQQNGRPPPFTGKKRPAPNPPLKKAPLPSSVLQISEPPREDLIYSKWLNI